MTHRPVFLSLACSLFGCLSLVAIDVSLIKSAHAAENQPASTSGQAGAKKSPAPASAKPAAAYDGPAVLDPSRFFGGAAMGYASAKAAPQVMSHLFCYCGCDATDKHEHLIDCFTSVHGVDCHICQEEAVAALKLNRDKTPLAEIQRQIDEEFSHHYPFTEETPNYKNYKASRLWKEGNGSAQSTGANPAEGGGTNVAGPLPASEDSKGSPAADGKGKPASKAPKSAIAPKVKPGFHVGNCCGPDSK